MGFCRFELNIDNFFIHDMNKKSQKSHMKKIYIFTLIRVGSESKREQKQSQIVRGEIII